MLKQFQVESRVWFIDGVGDKVFSNLSFSVYVRPRLLGHLRPRSTPVFPFLSGGETTHLRAFKPFFERLSARSILGFIWDRAPHYNRGTVVNRTYGLHNNLCIYHLFTNNIWFYLLVSPTLRGGGAIHLTPTSSCGGGHTN